MSDRSRHPQETDRAALEAYLLERGVPAVEIQNAQDFHELTLLAWRLIFRITGRQLSLEDAARLAGIKSDQIASGWLTAM